MFIINKTDSIKDIDKLIKKFTKSKIRKLFKLKKLKIKKLYKFQNCQKIRIYLNLMLNIKPLT